MCCLGWSDNSAVKSTTDCSSRGPELKSQQPYGGSQSSVTRPDSLFQCLVTATVYSHIINKINLKKKKRMCCLCGVVVHVFNPSTQEAEVGGSL